MRDLIFVVLGVFDAFAMLLLILKLYMLPVREYIGKILSFTVFIAVVSYVMRIILKEPSYDLPLQYLLFILFFRVGLKVKFHLASFIAGTGICAYTLLQVVVYYFYTWTHLIDAEVLTATGGFYVYLLQITSILLVYAICWLFERYSLGFSFIIVPPHDFLVKEDYFTNRNLLIVIGSIASLSTISITILLLYKSNTIALLAVEAVTLGLSFYFSRWSDRDDIRRAIEAYRRKDKEA